MYAFDAKGLSALRGSRLAGIGPNVLFLGLTSLLTDISSEMVASILPVYLVFALRLTPLEIGFVDGLYQGAATLTRLIGGVLADRWQRYREVAAIGYGVSAVTKLGLLLAGANWGAVSTLIALDRCGKGIRTAPRDALVSLSASADRQGFAFGVHRALDTVGALLGPIVAFAILATLPDGYDVVFVVSFLVAIVGLSVLLLFVRHEPRSPRSGEQVRGTRADLIALLRIPGFRTIVICGFALGIVTVGDAFIFLTLQKRTSLSVSTFPLLYVAAAAVFLLLAVPVGHFADRVGRAKVFLFGHALHALACLSILISDASVPSAAVSLLLLGGYYACTDGVLVALVSKYLPDGLRSTGIGLLTTVVGVSRLLASILFGALWGAWSLESALALFLTGVALALLLTARPLAKLPA